MTAPLIKPPVNLEPPTEKEMWDSLRTNMRDVSDRCERLARGERGDIYPRIRDCCRRVEAAARLLAYARDDWRFLKVSRQIVPIREIIRKKIVNHVPAAEFADMAKKLRAWLVDIEKVYLARTGTMQPILPKPLEGPVVAGRPVSMSGLILPDGLQSKRVH